MTMTMTTTTTTMMMMASDSWSIEMRVVKRHVCCGALQVSHLTAAPAI